MPGQRRSKSGRGGVKSCKGDGGGSCVCSCHLFMVCYCSQNSSSQIGRRESFPSLHVARRPCHVRLENHQLPLAHRRPCHPHTCRLTGVGEWALVRPARERHRWEPCHRFPDTDTRKLMHLKRNNKKKKTITEDIRNPCTRYPRNTPPGAARFPHWRINRLTSAREREKKLSVVDTSEDGLRKRLLGKALEGKEERMDGW